MRTAMVLKTLFKLETPKSVKDSNLDAKERIITERLARFFMAPPEPGSDCAKLMVILYSQ
jgi:hypothetical protein